MKPYATWKNKVLWKIIRWMGRARHVRTSYHEAKSLLNDLLSTLPIIQQTSYTT